MPKFPSSHVTLVTGASTGIGASTAAAFAQAGSQVAVHYNSSEAAAKAVAAGIQSAGGKSWLFQADLSKAAECRRLVADVLKTCGRIDVLVNNAGSLLDRKPLFEISDEFWQQVLDVNLNSAFWMTQAAARHMVERGSGAIINVSSIAARNGGGPGAIPYASAKGAVTTMTKGLARELIPRGVRVNAVNPGVILTPFHERFSTPERIKAMVTTIPQGRAGQAEEIAGAIVFLASNAASHVVGESIEINGGMLME
jgi:3-oxoacyl-[acyl-carrier protein] reductase